ncbi:GAF domain-containing protein [Kingella negevensis]|uniref:Free methionine-R-sulfoxide reductase n=1 Tax=Kingella negevensis TaxID=1522312 RepID=A0A238HFK2_9NEIS|nr:GAF domain-containing protein [Kingella negevensis]MDK4680095.1 GAF domain-containing protein [Kingella negevensis]MDK4682185.1 GAF domain-containing protein [Kingella negevensis]MDK4684404.1 GAF domain-containing protein [Kingella negevensis]MDK4688208.1 GAF domain-containing protein [Kingella negevensis]MDK4690382.1 GAF domain-containing protein [Kingella negevensis]
MYEIHSSVQSKSEKYEELLPQLRAVMAADSDLFIATLANTCAVLKEHFGWFWVGFYLVNKTGDELILAPFQGTIACTRIAKGRGVCGQSWARNEIMVVKDVNAHPDHIACSALSQSEIVLPVYNKRGEIVGVLDIDHTEIATFDDTDAHYLRLVCDSLTELLNVPELA